MERPLLQHNTEIDNEAPKIKHLVQMVVCVYGPRPLVLRQGCRVAAPPATSNAGEAVIESEMTIIVMVMIIIIIWHQPRCTRQQRSPSREHKLLQRIPEWTASHFSAGVGLFFWANKQKRWFVVDTGVKADTKWQSCRLSRSRRWNPN